MADTMERFAARLERLGNGGMRAVVRKVGITAAQDAQAFGRDYAGARMKTPTGNLRRSVNAYTVDVPSGVEVRLRAGSGDKNVRYAGIQEEGGTVRPKNGKFLAIPVGPARNAAGSARYASPRDVPGLVFVQSRKGQPLLVLADTRKLPGERKKSSIGTVMYVLRRSVTVSPKHYLRDAVAEAGKGVGAIFDREIAVALGAV